MAEKRYLFTPGPTPVPPEVLAAPRRAGRPPPRAGLPRRSFGECLERLRAVCRTENDVLLFTCSGHRRDGVGSREPLLARATGSSSSPRAHSASAGRSWPAPTAATSQAVEYEWGETPRAEDLSARLDELGGAKAVFLTHSETSTGVVARPPGARRGGEAVRRARRRRRRLQSLGAVPLETGRVGHRRRRLRLAEGADDAAGARARVGLAGGLGSSSARARASTSTGSARAPARRSSRARSPRPVSLVRALNVALGLLLEEGPRGGVRPPRSARARLPRGREGDGARAVLARTMTARRSSPGSSTPEGVDADRDAARASATATASRSPAATAT